MWKLKKILSSFTCLVLLVAFAGAIGFVYGSVSVTKPGTEVSQANIHALLNISVVSEEKDDANDQYAAVILPIMFFGLSFIFFILFQSLVYTAISSGRPGLRNCLYLDFRSLRL